VVLLVTRRPLPNAGGDADAGTRDPRVLLVFGVCFLVLSAWFLTTAVRNTMDLRSGVHTVGTVREHHHGAGDDRLRVTFTVANDEVTHELPSTTDRRMLDDGDRLAIVYKAGHPERVTAERDIGSGALLFRSGGTAVGLVLVTGPGLMLHHAKRRRVRGAAEGCAATGAANSPAAEGCSSDRERQ
jgi:hypothetical protein